MDKRPKMSGSDKSKKRQDILVAFAAKGLSQRAGGQGHHARVQFAVSAGRDLAPSVLPRSPSGTSLLAGALGSGRKSEELAACCRWRRSRASLRRSTAGQRPSVLIGSSYSNVSICLNRAGVAALGAVFICPSQFHARSVGTGPDQRNSVTMPVAERRTARRD